MPHFRVWIETTKKGTFLVRHEDALGNRATDYCVGPYEDAVIDGKKVTGKTLAKRFRDKVKQRFVGGELGSVDPSLLLSASIEGYLDWQRDNNFAPFSIIHSRVSLNAFLEETGMKVLNDITNERIGEWKKAMVKRKLANETIRGRLSNVRTFLNWLVEGKKLNVSPFGKKMMPIKIDPPIRFYTALEFKDLDQAIERRGDPITRLAINLAHSAGLRKIEMCGDGLEIETGENRLGVCYEDITWLPDGQAELLIRKEVAKGRKKARTIPLDPGLIELLGSRKSGPIIPFTRFQLDHFFQEARKDAEINPKLTIHGLRHTFAKNYLQRGQGNLASLKALLGHSSLMSTQIYAQFEKSYFQEGVQRAYERRLQEEALLDKIKIVG